jgi:hypothetical protein
MGFDMDEDELAKWASQTRPEVSDAVAADLRDHLTAIPSPDDVYGYAILPGDPTTSADGIGSLVAVYNRRADISVGPDESEFTYYKYSVDEWHHWDHGKFPRSDSILTSLNAQFAAAHQKDADDFEIDELQQAYSKSLLDAILDGVAIVKSEGRFSQTVEFLAIWISDSDNPILEESVRRLNSPEVAEEFLGEFGSAG